MRLDVFLVEKGVATSRRRAQDMIMAGKIAISGKKVTKPAYKVAEEDQVDVLEEDHPYVSRSALKLKGLLDESNLRFDSKIVLDVGASTGGFTQVSLEYGAAHVYAVDVGTDQLHPSLKVNQHITSLEQTDGRDLEESLFDKGLPTVLVTDVSFIAVSKILPPVVQAVPTLEMMCVLVKPQFELKPSLIGKNGIVKSQTDREVALAKVEKTISEIGFEIRHDMEASIAGQDGNREYMLLATKRKP